MQVLTKNYTKKNRLHIRRIAWSLHNASSYQPGKDIPGQSRVKKLYAYDKSGNGWILNTLIMVITGLLSTREHKALFASIAPPTNHGNLRATLNTCSQGMNYYTLPTKRLGYASFRRN
jgi:hypothetical protein